jgi:hypothetical protein
MTNSPVHLWQAKDITSERTARLGKRRAFYLDLNQFPIDFSRKKPRRLVRIRKPGLLSYVREFTCPLHREKTAMEACRLFTKDFRDRQVEFSCTSKSHTLGSEYTEITCKWVSSGLLHAQGLTDLLLGVGRSHTVTIEPHEAINRSKHTLLWHRSDQVGPKRTISADYPTLAQAVKANSKQHASLAFITTNPPKTVLLSGEG